MPDRFRIRPPRWYVAGAVGFLVAAVGVSALWEPSERVALASGITGAVVAWALVELAAVWWPRR